MPLVINIGFRFERTPVFKRVPEGAKSIETSSKSSSTEGRAGRFGEVKQWPTRQWGPCSCDFGRQACGDHLGARLRPEGHPVILQGRSSRTTLVKEIMTSPVIFVTLTKPWMSVCIS